MATVQILTEPIGSQLVQTIGNDDPEDVNDFKVYLVFSENVSLPDATKITLSSGAAIVQNSAGNIQGSGCCYEFSVRPPQSAAVVTLTVATNAVTEGNPATTKSIRISTSFPDTDAENPTQTFFKTPDNWYVGRGIAAAEDHLLVSAEGSYDRRYLHYFKFDGTHIKTNNSTKNHSQSYRVYEIDYFNGKLLYRNATGGWGIVQDLNTVYSYPVLGYNSYGLVHTRLGILSFQSNLFTIQPYDLDADVTTQAYDGNLSQSTGNLAHQDDIIYMYGSQSNPGANTYWSVIEITEQDTFQRIAPLNIRDQSDIPSGTTLGAGLTFDDLTILNDKIYLLNTPGQSSNYGIGVHEIDIRKYRPTAKKTKMNIPPIFVDKGGTIDLRDFAPDGEQFFFDVGYDKPSFLSVSGNTLSVSNSATPALVKLRSLNHIDSAPFEFYIIPIVTKTPVWESVSELSVRENAPLDLYEFVKDATTIAFQSGQTQPTGSTLTNGIFTIGTESGTAHFRATYGTQTADISIKFNVVPTIERDTLSEIFRYKVDIEGIDVSDDLRTTPTISKSLDPIVINEYQVNDASILLQNADQKYNPYVENSFWSENNLNVGGFRNRINILIEFLDMQGNWREYQMFAGIIIESFNSVEDVAFKINCVDIAFELNSQQVFDFGNIYKNDMAHRVSDEESYQGLYSPTGGFTPMQPKTGEAWDTDMEMEISDLELPSEGIIPANTGYFTEGEFRTAGDFLENNPLIRFKTRALSENIVAISKRLAKTNQVYNIEIDIPDYASDTDFVINLGNPAFKVEETRTSRIPVSLCYDVTNSRIFILLSNREAHIQDSLVLYDLKEKSYRVLRTFAKDVKVHQIVRRTATEYYILTSKDITQDSSRSENERTSQTTALTFDATNENSEIKIYKYNPSTDTLTEHVDEDDTYPPQLGLHYYVGFENPNYTDEFEGIVPHRFNAFKIYQNQLYYRYAKSDEFGVARVNASGTTAKRLGNVDSTEVDVIYLANDSSPRQIHVFKKNTGDEATAEAERTFNLPSAIGDPQGVAIDGNTIYIIDATDDKVYVGSSQTANDATMTISRQFNLPSGLPAPTGLAVDGDDLYVADNSSDEAVYVFSKNTGNNQTATVKRKIPMPSEVSNLQSVSVDETYMYIADASDDAIYSFEKNTQHNVTGRIIKRIDLPSTISSPYAAAVDSNLIYISDIADNTIYVISKLTATETEAEILKWFNIPSGITYGQGMDIGTGESLSIGNPITRQNPLNFNFDITTTGTVYFAHVHVDASESSLFIRRRTASGVEETLLQKTLGFADLTDLDNNGGVFRGVQECIFHENYLYLFVQVGRVNTDGTKDRFAAAGLVLYRCNVTASSPTLTKLQAWDFATHAASGFFKYDGSVCFFESTPVASKFKPYNPSLNSYQDSLNANAIPTPDGNIQKITSDGNIETLGSVWYSDFPYNVFLSTPIAVGNDFYFLAGYGNPDTLMRPNAIASRPDNFCLFSLTRAGQFILPAFLPRNTIYQEFAGIAKKTHATLVFNHNIIQIKDRETYTAQADGATGTSTVAVTFTDENKTLPDSGYLAIDNEIIKYTGITGRDFTGLTRGVLGTTIANHEDGAKITYLDNIIDQPIGEPYLSITFQSDTNRIYNIIRSSDNALEVRDTDSINRYGERAYTLDLGLTRHENKWREHIFKKYLNELKELQQVINIRIPPDPFIEIGHIIPFWHNSQLHIMRVIAIRYEETQTQIKGRTL